MSRVFTNILVTTDFSDASAAAIQTGIELAITLGANLHLLHVCDVSSFAYGSVGLGSVDLVTPTEDAADEQLADLLEAVKKRVPGATGSLRHGIAWSEVLAEIADKNADLVVMGTHGRRGLGRIVLGSVAEKVVRLSPVPVLTVRGKAPSRPDVVAA